MALKSLSFIMISALMVAASYLFGVFAALGGRKALAPGADPVAPPPDFDFDFVILNTKDPKVIDLANYAINEYSKVNNSKLVFTGVFEALYTDNEKGSNYGLIVAATNDKKVLNGYEAKILVAKDVKQLTAFRKIE